MSNPNPEHLLDEAVRLARPISVGAARQVDIRRAISAAYYAVFHMILAAAADLAIGRTRRGTPEYGLAYRSIDHRWLHTICDIAKRISPPPRYRPYVPDSGFGSDLRGFAHSTVVLQEQRHDADYDPLPLFNITRAQHAIDQARTALRHWAAAPEDERRCFLTLLLFHAR